MDKLTFILVATIAGVSFTFVQGGRLWDGALLSGNPLYDTPILIIIVLSLTAIIISFIRR